MREFNYDGKDVIIEPRGKSVEGGEKYTISSEGNTGVVTMDPGDYDSMAELYINAVEQFISRIESSNDVENAIKDSGLNLLFE